MADKALEMGSFRLLATLVLVVSGAELRGEQYPFRVYDQTAGLANPTVQAIQSDADGFLWIGTANGLFRFDGTRFRLYDGEMGLPGNRINSMLNTPDGTLWVATDKGLVRRRPHRPHRPHRDDQDDRFEIIDFGKKIMTVPGSLLAWHPTAGLLFTSSEGLVAISGEAKPHLEWLQPRGAFGTAVDRQSRIWFGCNKAICRMDDWRQPAKLVKYTEAEGLPAGARWHALLADRQGRIWARGSEGVARWEPSRNRFEIIAIDAHSSAFAGLHEDRHGRVLLPSEQGLWIYEREAWTLVDSTRGLPMDTTLSVGEDREGGLWVGTAAAGVARWLGDGNWSTLSKADGLPNPSVWNMLRDR